MEESSEARQRVLDAAERLFAQKGYAAVTLRDIGSAVSLAHASLYHHAPGGKEQLFIEVTERNLKRHADGMTQGMAAAAPHLRAQLQAAAYWLLDQPPMDFIRFTHSDAPAIDPAQAGRLMQLVLESMLEPIVAVLEAARERGDLRYHDMGVVAGGFVGMIEGLHAIPEGALVHKTRRQMADQLIDLLLHGLLNMEQPYGIGRDQNRPPLAWQGRAVFGLKRR